MQTREIRKEEIESDSGKWKGQMEAAPEKRLGGIPGEGAEDQDTGEDANSCIRNKIYGRR